MVDDNDVSDYDDEIDGKAKNRDKAERFNQIKDRLRKGKFSKETVRGGRLLRAVFKTVTSIIQVLAEVRESRNLERDQRVLDFQNVLPLYNEVLKTWLIRCVKTPILTVIRQPDVDMDFIPLDNTLMREVVRNARFQ